MRCLKPFQGILNRALCAAALGAAAAGAADFALQSPAGNITVTLSLSEGAGALSYKVQSGGTEVIGTSSLGILTSKGDFTGGLALASKTPRVIDESYWLPSGKWSTYVNHANELELTLTKGGQEMHLFFRAYDDGIAFRYAVPGTGNIEVTGENTTFALGGGTINYWGMAHPNNYGYETPLSGINGSNTISVPALCELTDKKHFLFVAQAGTYGNYIIPWYQRQGGTLKLMFPLDQKTPVKTTLPFASPWRMVIVSPNGLGKITESMMMENLNPPTEPELVGAPWIKSGGATWDFIAGDGANLKPWIDFDADMGWSYHVADAGWEGRVQDMAGTTAYGKTKGVGIIVWGKVANKTFLNTPERAEAWMANLEKLGISGAKIDFFDQQDTTHAATADLEDTQYRLWIRDFLSTIAIKHKLLVEFHGCAVPSGERRRWPNLMAAEAVSGAEHRQSGPTHELLIPFVRDIMGPTSFTPVNLARTVGSYGWMLGETVAFETGIQIFSDSPDKYKTFPGLPFMKVVPANWDETKFIEGYPASYISIARRKGPNWFIGGMSSETRTAQIPLGFLRTGATYEVDIYRDGGSKTTLTVEKKTLTSKDALSIPVSASGGFAVYLKDANPIGVMPLGAPARRRSDAWSASVGLRGWGNKGVTIRDMQGRLVPGTISGTARRDAFGVLVSKPAP
jgi:alpha-glucosidase